MKWLYKLGLFIVGLLLLELLLQVLEVQTWIFPKPSDVLIEFYSEGHVMFYHLSHTLMLAVIGFSLSVIFAILTAVTLHHFNKLEEMVYPFLLMTQNVPIIVLAPLFVIWFGFGMLPKLIVIILFCFFPIAVNTLDGLKRAPGELMDYLSMQGATKRQMFWLLEWPNCLPYFFSGLRIAVTYSVMGAVVAEWLGTSRGLGFYLLMSQSNYRTSRVFAAIVLIMVSCYLFYSCIVKLEKIFCKGVSTS